MLCTSKCNEIYPRIGTAVVYEERDGSGQIFLTPVGFRVNKNLTKFIGSDVLGI